MGLRTKIGGVFPRLRRNPLCSLASKMRSAFCTFGALEFQCNVCGGACKTKITELTRECPSCPVCGSTVRMRAIIHLLSRELFGESLALPDFPVRQDIKGMGLSDWDRYAAPLTHKLNYINTHYQREPHLDITDIDPALSGSLDFLISSDVFEHVAPPVSVAFANAAKLLKPGGVLIFSVPYVVSGPTLEHFPDLYEYKLSEKDGRHVLQNVTKDGRNQTYEDLIFHGGEGFTLQMRIFSLSPLLDAFSEAGFDRVMIHREPDFLHGIYWHEEWALPITARKI
jgi:SAM-dependent methyltransferase